MNTRWKTFAATCCLSLPSVQASVLPDRAFGEQGVVTLDLAVLSSESDERFVDGLVDQWRRVVAVGTAADRPDAYVPRRRFGLVARYLADGTPDTSFDEDGHKLVDWKGNEIELLAVREQADGRLLLAGHVSDISDAAGGIVCRLHVDGTFDNSFGDNGCSFLLDVRDAPGAASIVDIEPLPDGNVLALGHASYTGGAPGGAALFRLDTFGKIDLDFGDDDVCESPAPRCGVAFSPAALGHYLTPAALALHRPSQRLLVAADVNAEGLHALPVLAFDMNGTFESVRYAFTYKTLGYSGDHDAVDIHVAGDGSTFLSGRVSNGPSDTRVVVAKLDPLGQPDSFFGESGLALGELVSAVGPTVLHGGDAVLVSSTGRPYANGPVQCRITSFDAITGSHAILDSGGGGLMNALDARGTDCIANGMFSGAGGLYVSGNLEQASMAEPSAFLFRMDANTLMRDGFED